MSDSISVHEAILQDGDLLRHDVLFVPLLPCQRVRDQLLVTVPVGLIERVCERRWLRKCCLHI